VLSKRYSGNLWRSTEESRSPSGLGGGLREKYGPIGENWDYDGAEMGLGRREWEREE